MCPVLDSDPKGLRPSAIATEAGRGCCCCCCSPHPFPEVPVAVA